MVVARMLATARNSLLAQLNWTLFNGVAVAGLVLLLACPANATPIEEDIPNLPNLPAAYQVKAPPAAATAPRPAPARSASPSAEAVKRPAASWADRSDAGRTTPTAVHKYFPYTIRPGDTLTTIADIFSVQINDITRANRRIANGELMAGDTIRIPNPLVTRESELNAEIERLSIDKQEAERKADQAANALAAMHSQLEAAATSNARYEHDLHTLPWWRMAAWLAGIAGVVMFGLMLAAVIEWWKLRLRYRAVADMNDSLRRLDNRYRTVMAKAELRLQQLYGRRRRGFEEGQERPKIPEETEIEQLDLQIKEVLERFLERLGPPGNQARRARWREMIGGVGAPIEVRTARR